MHINISYQNLSTHLLPAISLSSLAAFSFRSSRSGSLLSRSRETSLICWERGDSATWSSTWLREAAGGDWVVGDDGAWGACLLGLALVGDIAVGGDGAWALADGGDWDFPRGDAWDFDGGDWDFPRGGDWDFEGGDWDFPRGGDWDFDGGDWDFPRGGDWDLFEGLCDFGGGDWDFLLGELDLADLADWGDWDLAGSVRFLSGLCCLPFTAFWGDPDLDLFLLFFCLLTLSSSVADFCIQQANIAASTFPDDHNDDGREWYTLPTVFPARSSVKALPT